MAEDMDHEASIPQGNITFALTPAMTYEGLVDYSTAQGRKLYDNATAKLDDELFDCNAEDLYAFLKSLKDRARDYGWEGVGTCILSIPDDPEYPYTLFTSLIDNHGEISIETIRQSEESYICNESRAAQDTAQLYKCLMTSLSRSGKKKVHVWSIQYTIGNLGSGALLLKVIIRESHLDTNATSTNIRTNLTKLDKYLPTIGYDITKFNTHVKILVEGLKSRGETTQDLLVNLFKGYLACSDKEFVSYITTKKDKHEEGVGIKPDELMTFAENKYKTLIQNET